MTRTRLVRMGLVIGLVGAEVVLSTILAALRALDAALPLPDAENAE